MYLIVLLLLAPFYLRTDYLYQLTHFIRPGPPRQQGVAQFVIVPQAGDANWTLLTLHWTSTWTLNIIIDITC